MALPNDIEQNAIKEFRSRVEDIVTKEELEDDMFLLRWIRARELDLNKAEAMLRNAKKWRENNKVDDILNKKIDRYFFENYPRWTDGVDKQGRPIYAAATGQWDLRKVVKDNRSEEFLEYTTEGFERLMARIKEINEERAKEAEGSDSDPKGQSEVQPKVTQILGIFDFEGFAWSQLLNYKAVQNFLSLGSIYEAYYPEICYQIIFINSPSLISKVLYLLKPVLAPKTMAKLRVLGTDKEEWKAELLEIVDADQILPQFGGTRGLIQSE